MKKHLRRFFSRILTLARSDKAEADLSREIRAHLQLLEDKYVAQGMSASAARTAARRAFGGVEQTKELQRDARTFRWLAGWPIDLRLGLRMLIKSPGLTVIGIIALAVAIGSGAAYFEFVNDFVRPSLSFPGGNRLLAVIVYDVSTSDVEGRTAWEFLQWRRQLRTIEELGAARGLEQNLTTDDGRVEPARGVEITAAGFRVIPTPPLFGRPLTEDDERPGAPPVVVIGHDLWQSRFNGDPAIVGRTAVLGDTPHTIVGVMPEGFGFPVNHALWTPLQFDSTAIKRGEGPSIRIFGRLAPGADLDAARAEVSTLMASAPDAATFQHRRPQVDYYVRAIASTPNMRWQVRIVYSVNLFFIGLLGICGANVATLVFARTASREGEITVRTALGASRSRIVSQLVIEALVLASIAATVGLLGASTVVRYVRDIFVEAQGEPMPFWWDARLGIETVLYAAVLVVLAALLVGGVPALKATGAVMQARLKQAGASGSSMRFGRLWTGIIVVQVALTLVFLLTTLSLGLETYRLDRRFQEVLFPRQEYLTARINAPEGFPPDRANTAFAEIERRLAQEPAVTGITWTTRFPGMGQEEFWVELPVKQMQDEAFARSRDDVLWVRSTRVAADFFATLNVPLVAGRTFTLSETESNHHVAIVDESFVSLVLGGRAAVGQLVRQAPRRAGDPPGPWLEIVGVVKDISTLASKQVDEAMIYRPFTPTEGNQGAWPWRIVIHVNGDAAALGTPLRRATVAADAALRLEDVLTMDRVAEADALAMNFFVRSLGIVSALALLLSIAGIYSLISFTLARRTREIGIRIALGAAPHRIVTGVLSKALYQIGFGVLVGAVPGVTILAIGLEDDTGGTTLVQAIALTLGMAALVLGIAAVSCAVPLRRALRVEPTQALRAE